MASTVGGVNLKLGLKVGGFMRNMRLASKEMSFSARNAGRLKEKVDKVGATFGTAMRAAHVLHAALSALAMAAGAAATAFIAFATTSSTVFGGFEHEMTKTFAVTNGALGRQGDMYAEASRLAMKYGVAHKDVAAAMGFVGMAGNDVNGVLAMTKDIMAVATVGQMDFAAAGDIMTNIMTGFGLEADKSNEVLNTLVGTMVNSNTNLRMLGDAMKYVGAKAHRMNISIQQTSAALGFLADAGIQGEMGGTALRNVLVNFEQLNSSKRKIAKKMGLDLFDSDGKLKKDIIGIVKEIEKMDSAAPDLGYLIGKRGMQGLEPLLMAGSQALEDYTKYLEEYNKANGVADEMLRSFNNQLRIFKTTVEEVLMGPGLFFKEMFISIRRQLSLTDKEFLQLKLDIIDFAAEGTRSFLSFARTLIDVMAFIQTVGGTTLNIMELGVRSIFFALSGVALGALKLLQVATRTYTNVIRSYIRNMVEVLEAVPASIRKKFGLDENIRGLKRMEAAARKVPLGIAEIGRKLSANIDDQKKGLSDLANNYVVEADKSLAKMDATLASIASSTYYAQDAAKKAMRTYKSFDTVDNPFEKKRKWFGDAPSVVFGTAKGMAEDRAKAIADAMKKAKKNTKVPSIAEGIAESIAEQDKEFHDTLDAVLKEHEERRKLAYAQATEMWKLMFEGLNGDAFDSAVIGDEVARKNFEMQQKFMTMEEKRVALAERHNEQLERQLDAMGALMDLSGEFATSYVDYQRVMGDASATKHEKEIASQKMALDLTQQLGSASLQLAKVFGASRRQMAIAQTAVNGALLIGAILSGNWGAAIAAGAAMLGGAATAILGGQAKSTFSAPEDANNSAEEARAARTQEAIEAALKAAGLWQQEAREQTYNYYGGDTLVRNRNRDAAAIRSNSRRGRRGSM